MTNQQFQENEGKSNSEHLVEGLASRTVAQLESQATRSATVVSQIAHRAAEKIDQTTESLLNAGRRTLNTAQGKSREIRESVRQNPLPLILGGVAIGFGIAYFLKRKRNLTLQ